MLTAEGCRIRRGRLWDRLPAPPDWIVLADPQHLVYFANYWQSPFVFRSANAAALLILGRDGSSVLVCDNMLQVFAAEAHVDEVAAGEWYRGAKTAPQRETLLVHTALERLRGCPGNSFGIETSAVPAGVIEGLRAARGGASSTLTLTAVDAAIHELKRSKDPDEMTLIRRSMAAGDAAHEAALRGVRPGMTELEAYLLVSDAAQRAAGEQAQVYGDFVSGPRCETKGGPPSDRIIEAGDLVLLDFSVVVRGYRGDFANTFVCGRRPSDEQRRLYEACLEALSAGERAIGVGVHARDLDRAVRDSFAARRLAENFTSHSGHGLGLGHPDPPYLVPESSDTLVAGDVIAIEPGQYIRGQAGMRFERNYLVTAAGYETLSHLRLEIDQEG
jgi:Xaa-Pro aminopeptidase